MSVEQTKAQQEAVSHVLDLNEAINLDPKDAKSDADRLT